MNPLADVFCPNYDTLLHSLSLYPDTEHPSALLSPDYLQEPAVQVPEVPEEPEPRDPGPSPPSLHHHHPDLPADPTVRYPAGDDGGYGSIVLDLADTEESDLTDSTDLDSSTEDTPDPRDGHLLRMDSVCDLRDGFLFDQQLYDVTLRQRDRLRVSVLSNVRQVLGTLAGDPYLLHQARDYLDDLITGLLGLPSRDQTPSAL